MSSKSKTLIFSSDPVNGAKQISSRGDSFQVTYDSSVSIPAHATSCYGQCLEANIWYSDYNISAELGNNIFSFTISGGVHNITFPNGLFDLERFNDEIRRYLLSINKSVTDIVFEANEATQKIVVHFGSAGIQIHFGTSPGINELLGFEAVNVPVGLSVAKEHVTAPNTAKMNHINQYIIHSDIVGSGIPVNDLSSSIVAPIQIDVIPNKQIFYRPFNPIKVDMSFLIGQQRDSVRCWLTNERGGVVDTNDQPWSFLLEIVYTE